MGLSLIRLNVFIYEFLFRHEGRQTKKIIQFKQNKKRARLNSTVVQSILQGPQSAVKCNKSSL